MKKYKVVVYAISKNEEKFVNRWVDSMSEADEIYVLDTGSTDNTVKLLKKRKVHVTKKVIEPFRFDIARNESLALVPKDTDICVCTDLDEVFTKGWRDRLESIWNKDTTRVSYNYNWYIENEIPKVNFYIEKIHSRFDYTWIHPVHEVLSYIGNKKEIKVTSDTITLNHYPDTTKSRASYLPLLELSVKEDPTDDRNMHYLGREYMYYHMWNESIDTLIKHLKLPHAIWKDERCASMRFIARDYLELDRVDEARMWLNKAIKEAPYLRDPYVEMALLEYREKNYELVKKYCLDALKITTHQKTYINEIFSWDHTLYDLLSICYFYQNDVDKAIYYIDKALEISPDIDRLKNNKQIFIEYKNSLK